MHILQPKHTKLSEKDSEEILKRLNLAKAQLPKILSTDAGLPDGCAVGDIIKIERKSGEYFRVVV
jgi:DNA-directed RNA polymerase subunit H (RpoH/RPB5)